MTVKFKFDLGQRVKRKSKDETGTVIGLYIDQQHEKYVLFKCDSPILMPRWVLESELNT